MENKSKTLFERFEEIVDADASASGRIINASSFLEEKVNIFLLFYFNADDKELFLDEILYEIPFSKKIRIVRKILRKEGVDEYIEICNQLNEIREKRNKAAHRKIIGRPEPELSQGYIGMNDTENNIFKERKKTILLFENQCMVLGDRLTVFLNNIQKKRSELKSQKTNQQ
jgi:hypothetical protein